MILFNIQGRCWNFKENYTGGDSDIDTQNVIWVKWGDPCTGTPHVTTGCQEPRTVTTSDLCDNLCEFGDIKSVKDSLVS